MDLEVEDLKEIEELMRLDRFLGMIRSKPVNLTENLKKEFKHVELQSFLPHLGEDDWQAIPATERLPVLQLLNDDPKEEQMKEKVKDDSKDLQTQVLATTKLTAKQWQNLDPDSQEIILESLSKLDDYATKSKSKRNIEKLSDPVKKVINLSQQVWDKLPESAHQAILLKFDKLEEKVRN